MKVPGKQPKASKAAGHGKKRSRSIVPKLDAGWENPVSRMQVTHGNQATLRLIERTSQRASTDVAEAFPSPGQPLGASTRELMESRLGRRFGGVRIHTDAHAAQQARELGARAFTVDKHIIFGEGAYQPGTAQGNTLLAHELTHVAQPKAAGNRLVSTPGDASEREAARAAKAVMYGDSIRVGTVAGAPLQRQELPGVMSGKLNPPSRDALTENASPLLASALGSATLDNFETGKADLKREHERQLTSVSHAVEVLLRKYGTSTMEVIGFADTVGAEAKNIGLGQERADAVKQALTDRGVPEGIIHATSKGEGGPQAVKTKDEVPSAANRRVEVRFHPGKSRPGILGGTLTMPDPNAKVPEPFNPFKPVPPDIFKRKPPYTPEPGPDEPRDFFKPTPPPIKGTGPKSFGDVVGEIIDPAVDKLFGGLSKSKRDWLKEKGRDAVKAGLTSIASKAAESLGVTDPGALKGIEKAVEAAIKEKGEREPPGDDRFKREPPAPRDPESYP